MADLLDERLNLEILNNICAGNCLSINYTYLAKKFRKHRNTIRKEVLSLLAHKIINKPIFPFFGHYREHHLMVLMDASLPLSSKIVKWIKEDNHIFAAYKVKKGEYNLLFILFHRNFLRYNLWIKEAEAQGNIPRKGGRYSTYAMFFPTERMVKYDPSANIELLEQIYSEKKSLTISDYSLSSLSLQILKCLLKGEGIRLNENMLAKKLNIHRKTLSKRINSLLEGNMILKPACRFPSLFSPPDSMLIVSLLEISQRKDDVLNYMKNDPHISVIMESCYGSYNYLLFETFDSIKDHIEWEHKLMKKFKDCFGQNEATFLTPNMTINVDQQKVSLTLIRKKLSLLNQKPKSEVWSPFVK